MIKISRQITMTVLIITIISSLASCGGASSNDSFKVTDAFVSKYMGAIVEGKTDDVFDYEYQEASITEGNESIDAADMRPRYWIDSVKDYIVKEKEKVNDNLFVYTMLLASSENLDLFKKMYFFVVRIDGTLYIADSPYVIPDEIKDNFDESKYAFDDPNMNYTSPDVQG